MEQEIKEMSLLVSNVETVTQDNQTRHNILYEIGYRAGLKHSLEKRMEGAGQEKNIVKRPPFTYLMQFCAFLPRKYRNNLEQNISDMRIEYYEALNAKNIWYARTIVGFYYAGLSWTVVRWIAGRVKELVGFMPKMN